MDYVDDAEEGKVPMFEIGCESFKDGRRMHACVFVQHAHMLRIQQSKTVWYKCMSIHKRGEGRGTCAGFGVRCEKGVNSRTCGLSRAAGARRIATLTSH